MKTTKFYLWFGAIVIILHPTFIDGTGSVKITSTDLNANIHFLTTIKVDETKQLKTVIVLKKTTNKKLNGLTVINDKGSGQIKE